MSMCKLCMPVCMTSPPNLDRLELYYVLHMLAFFGWGDPLYHYDCLNLCHYCLQLYNYGAGVHYGYLKLYHYMVAF